MLDLEDCKVGLALILLSNLDHVYGPKYLKECFLYYTLLNLATSFLLKASSLVVSELHANA